mmetsp:Transcript_9392/g.20567  ORF Transcript_9392/g.20567 Transcript_9392/m.20567 type:complete len:496 (+) Transcript_9392:126-1613(+)
MRAATLVLCPAVGLLQGGTAWVPIQDGPSTRYFNPASSELLETPPQGAKLAPTVKVPRVALLSQDPDAAPEAEVSEHKACFPHCTWNCTQPVCNQDCTPDCEQPRCQTRCPRPDYSQCQIDCKTPHCSVFCPKNACKSEEGSDCSSPKCETRCARPVCYLKCADHVPCQNVCHPPRCTWNCRNPKVCPKPQCRLVCEKAKGCAQNYELPALSPAFTVQGQFHAERAHWITFGWGKCGDLCGESVRTRKVVCSTGEDHECSFSPKPPTQEVCTDNTGCNQWRTGEWSPCSHLCGKGKKTRKVWCSHDDERECLGEKPISSDVCVDHGKHCSVCDVTLFGGSNFNGWQQTFGVGKYGSDDLIARGAKCEETSSMKVNGLCCKARVYEYGDFNHRTNGFKVKLGHGDYDQDAMESHGIENNDVSALKVWLDERCVNEGQPAFGLKVSEQLGIKMHQHDKAHHHEHDDEPSAEQAATSDDSEQSGDAAAPESEEASEDS